MSRYRVLATIVFTVFSLLVLTSPVQAQNLKAAKEQGLIGETSTGYLDAVTPASAEMRQLMNKINGERKHQYQEIAAQNGTPVGAVEALAGKKAIELSAPGEFVQTSDGKWHKK